MDIEIREFITYLHNTKKTSANTEISYQRDLKKMAEFLKERGIRNYKDVKELELVTKLKIAMKTIWELY